MRLTKRLEMLLLMACKEAGCYDPNEALFRVEEVMTPAEYKAAERFLTWVNANTDTRKFGPANIKARFNEYLAK